MLVKFNQHFMVQTTRNFDVDVILEDISVPETIV